MTDSVETTPAEEVKDTETTTASPTEETPAPVEAKEQTVGDIIAQETPKEEPKTVGLDKFLELKKQNKELKASLEALETKIEEGATGSEISDDIEALAEEHGVDKAFLKKFASTFEKRAQDKLNDAIDERLRPIEERAKAEKFDATFNKQFAIAIEKFPEHKDIVNPAVIKALALQPSNKDKTFSQLIEEAYGNALGGKRTIETTTPHGGKEPMKVDIERAKKDPAYFREVMADPEMKKQYNEGITGRIAV